MKIDSPFNGHRHSALDEIYAKQGLVRREPSMTASEAYHAHRWRIAFAIALCVLAVGTILLVLKPVL